MAALEPNVPLAIWDRSGEVDRAAFQRRVIGDLNARKVPFITLRGALDERVARVCELLSRFGLSP